MVSSYFREIFIAAKFGATAQADAYLSVVTLIRFVCDVGPCAVLLACVVPVVAALTERPAAVRGTLLSILALATLAATGLLMLALWLSMPWLLSVAAPGFADPVRQMGIEAAASMAWFLPLQSLGFMFALMLNAHGRFWAAAAAPMLSNGMFVLVLALSGAQPGIDALCWATLAGPALTASLLGAVLWRMDLFRWQPSAETAEALASLWTIARPMILSLGLGSSTGLLMICHLLLRREGSLAGEGTVAALAYAFRIYEVPVSLVANVAGTLVLPSLSALYGTAATPRLGGICRGLIEWGILLLAPVVVVTAMTAPFLVDMVLVHGRFSSADAARTAEALKGFAPAILIEAAIVVFYRVLYAIRRPKVAMVASATVIGCLLVLAPLAPAGDVGRLALAFSVSFAAGVLVVAWSLYRQFRATVLPFPRRVPAMLAVFALSGLVWPALAEQPLAGMTAFSLVYVVACLLLLPEHRAALIGVLRREARA